MRRKPFRRTSEAGMDLTEGNVFLTVLFFAIPLMLSNLIQQLYNTVDLIIVGQSIGNAGLSAVGNGGELTEIYTTFAVGFSSAGQTVTAQLTGAKNHRKIAATVGTQLNLMLSIGCAFAVLTILLGGQFLRLINMPEDAFVMAKQYLLITALGIPFVFGYNAVSGILRGIGESKATLMFISVAACLNLVLDCALVIGLDMGAAGAAIATVIAQMFAFVAAGVFFYKKRSVLHFKFSLSNFRIRRQECRVLVGFGLPMAVHSMLIHFTQLFCNAFINDYGLVASSVNSAGTKIIRFCTVYTNSINVGMASVVGQNIGARKFDRVRQVLCSGLIIAGSISILCCILLLTIPHEIFSLFSQDQEVIAGGVSFLRIAVIGFLLAAVQSPFGAVITGSGNARLNFIAGILDGVVLRVGISFLFAYAFDMGVFGFFYGNVLARMGPCMICFVYYLSGNWKKKKLLIGDSEHPAADAS